MCRWLAYCGSPIYLESLILKPENSLIAQSRHALQSASATNGDGFGVGWYGDKAEPGLYRNIQPAWNDDNLRSMSCHIRSGLFFGHVRASTGTSTSYANCHPFVHDNWMFMHNGKIGRFETLRRELALLVEPKLFSRIQGTTDSEALFYLLLTNGLRDDAVAAFGRTIAQVLGVMEAAGVEEAFTMTAAASDGKVVYALRYASDGEAPSLFYGCGTRPQCDEGIPVADTEDSILILSEPLDHDESHWNQVPESHVLVAGGGGVAIQAMEPAPPRSSAA